jgi:hypothetical protein
VPSNRHGRDTPALSKYWLANCFVDREFFEEAVMNSLPRKRQLQARKSRHLPDIALAALIAGATIALVVNNLVFSVS